MDTGWKSRLEILRRDAERKILSKLKTHGWTASITSEVSKGDYVIIEANRGGHTHKCALMYSSATANAIYKSLESVVEHIFINSALYQLESFAYGIKTPILVADDFQHILVSWNESSADGDFAPVAEEEELDSFPEEDMKYNRIQSENPLQSVWIHLRQLESVTLSKKNIAQRSKVDSIQTEEQVLTTKSEGLAYALRNASDYFRLADGRNMSQRILNLYYGTLAFSFAEMLSAPDGPATLAEIEDSTKQGHGLFTLDGQSDRLEDLIVGVIGNGFFPKYMEFLGRDTKDIPVKKLRKFEEMKEGERYEVTFEALISRIPDIGDLFVNIFDSKPGWVIPVYDSEANTLGFGSSKKLSRSYALLIDNSGRWSKEDILELKEPMSEIAQLPRKDRRKKFRVAINHEGHANFWPSLTLHSSPFIDQALIVPIFGSVKEFRAISLVILYTLSIVVRYRPSLWRRVQEGDLDYMRVLIEAYLDVVERVLPEQYLGQITGKTIVAKQPGSLF